MSISTTYEIGNALINLANAARTFTDPNASNKDKVDAVVNAASFTLTMLGTYGSPTAGGAWYMTGVGVGMSQLNFISSLGSLATSIQSFSDNPNDANLNGLIQSVGGSISAFGGAIYSVGVASNNPWLYGIGLGKVCTKHQSLC